MVEMVMKVDVAEVVKVGKVAAATAAAREVEMVVAVGAGEDSAEEGGSWGRKADATANVAQNMAAKTADGALFRESLAESSSATLVSLEDMCDGSRGDRGAKGGGGDSNDFLDLDSELEEALSPGPQGW